MAVSRGSSRKGGGGGESPRLIDVELEKIIDSIDEAIIGCDKDGRINIYNSANERREGMNRGMVLNRHVDEVYDFHGNKSLMMRAVREGKPILDQYQEYTVLAGGNTVEIICSTVPIKEGNRIIGAVSVMKDYSKMKKLSKIITDLQSSLYSTNRRKGKETGKTGARHTFEDIVGSNNFLKEVLRWAQKTAENSLPVLIYGETGTGKELLAQSIHNAGDRKGKPFIAVNCAAIPENLLEGILFGTSKGAFTGAIDRPGLFEQATGGTLVLDEINSMNLPLQSKLLRVIQEEVVRRVGDIKVRKIDTRLISISNKEPLEAIEQGELREDLYYRIAYIALGVPPLRKRVDDLPLLIEHIIGVYNRKLGLNIQGVASSLSTSMERYAWPGNVRELEHVIAAGMSSLTRGSRQIASKDLPPHIKHKFAAARREGPVPRRSKMSLSGRMEHIEKILVERALKRNNWNISRTARELGLKRQSLQYRIKKYAL